MAAGRIRRTLRASARAPRRSSSSPNSSARAVVRGQRFVIPRPRAIISETSYGESSRPVKPP